MGLSKYVDPARCMQLLTGTTGIYLSYLYSGILHESMLKEPYVNDFTQIEQNFKWAQGFLIFPCGIAWLIGYMVNLVQIPAQERVAIPALKSAGCAVAVAISTLTYTYAIYFTNFPVVMMFKSCNILSIILVGVLCSRVKDKKLKLGKRKIIIGLVITLGIIIFKLADPSFKKDDSKTELAGIIFLLVSLLADGFLPDLQAQIKSQFKPRPLQMMVQINKWVTIIAIVYSIIMKLQIIDICEFMISHQKFLIKMIVMGVLSTFGQMFVYHMIKQFKQHFVPFVITTRKIFTVGLSIIFYNHETNFVQFCGIALVFFIVTYEFVSELMGEKMAHHKDLQLKQQRSADSFDHPHVDIISDLKDERLEREKINSEEDRENKIEQIKIIEYEDEVQGHDYEKKPQNEMEKQSNEVQTQNT